MSISSQIMAKLGLDSSKFSQGLNEAATRIKAWSASSQNEAKGIAQSFEGLRKVFIAGGIITGVKAFFDTAISYSREYAGATDEAVNATRRLGDTLDGIKLTGAKAGVAIVGWIESASIGLASLVYGAEAAADALDAMNAATAGAASEEAIQKRAAAENALAKTRRDIAMSEADAYGRLAILINESLDLKQQQRALEEGSAEWLTLQASLEKNLAEQRKADAAARKGDADAIRQKEEATLASIAEAEKARATRMDELLKKREALVAAAAAEAEQEKRIASIRAAGTAAGLDFTMGADGNPTDIRAARGGVGGGSFDRGAMFLLGGERTFNDPAAQLAYEKRYKEQTLEKLNAEIAQLEREYQDTKRRAAYGGQTRAYMAPLQLERLTALRNRRANVDRYLFDPNYQDGAGRSIPGQQIEVMGGKFEDYAKATAKSLDDIRRILTDKGITVRNFPNTLPAARP